MPQADQYEPGQGETKTEGRRSTGVSATGENAGPDIRASKDEDTIQGTTSEEGPQLRGKPEKGSRLDADA